MAQIKKGLGKGLNALISSNSQESDEYVNDTIEKSGVVEIDINMIEPNKQQPRKYFDQEALIELSESLKDFGIIQPIVVKKEGDYYSIIAGERRWRAARIAKMEKIPVIIKDYNDAQMLQIALIENLQRQDLNPIEEALCYKRLADEFFYSQENIAQKVGRSRNSISYSLSLLNLDKRVQNFLAEGKLTSGHARFLFQIKDNNKQFEFSEKIIEEGLSVRETERIIKLFLDNLDSSKNENETKTNENKPISPYKSVEADLKSILGTKVNIKDGKNKGKIEIEYYSPDELDRILGIFKKIEA